MACSTLLSLSRLLASLLVFRSHSLLPALKLHPRPAAGLTSQVRYGIHGGALETSLMLHLHPELVSMDSAKDFASRAARQPKEAALQMHAPGFATKAGWQSQDLNAHGVVGAAASLSCAHKGEVLAEECVDGLVRLLTEVHAADAEEILGTVPMYPPQGDVAHGPTGPAK